MSLYKLFGTGYDITVIISKIYHDLEQVLLRYGLDLESILIVEIIETMHGVILNSSTRFFAELTWHIILT